MQPLISRPPVALPAAPDSALHAVEPRPAPEAAQLWIGVHMVRLGSGATPEQLATTALRFSPRVSLLPPDGLLLEVKGSLHLFEGMEGLLQALARDCAALGIEPLMALAPTPLAAIVAARAGNPCRITNSSQLASQLAGMPLAPLRWPADLIERLARMGVRTIGQTLRLPRAGFARRFGPLPLNELDRLMGRQADPQRQFTPRERFRRRRELSYELESNQGLIAVLKPVLVALGRFLEVRQYAITELQCQLWHRQAAPTVCVLRLSSPLADIGRLTELLRERLNSVVLPEPVRSCELRTGVPVARLCDSNSLWQAGEHGSGSGSGSESSALIETLRARLGHESVYGLQVQQGHRPESTWSVQEPDHRQRGGTVARTALPWAACRRPLWLLSSPRQLEESGGVPCRGGALRFSGSVERIETGWWDGGAVARDYYTVVDVHGAQLWIFREQAMPHRWFLHGVFG